MKIQILYFEGCPNHPPSVELVGEVVKALDVDVTIEEVEVKGQEDAQEHQFLGSPTILIDGIDIEPSARSRTNFGFSCRTYDGEGLPSRDMVVAAVKGQDYTPSGGEAATSVENRCGGEQKSKDESGLLVEKTGPGRWIIGGSVIAAVVASACCWLPLLLISSGVSAGGIGMIFEQTRPIFLSVAAVLLAAGFYFTYIRKEKCDPGSACATPSPRLKRINRMIFWVATVGVVAFALFPSYVGVFQPAGAVPVAVENTTASALLTLKVDGMSCEGCAVNLHNELLKVAGVLNAEVKYEEGKAFVSVNSTSPPSTESLIAAVEKAGYKGSLTKVEFTGDGENWTQDQSSVSSKVSSEAQVVAARSAEEEIAKMKGLKSVDELKTQFNADAEKRRLLLLLSPT